MLEVTVKLAPTIRYTQDNNTAIAEMNVSLMERISQELSSGEILNLMEGYPSDSTVMIVKEIIDYDFQFEPFVWIQVILPQG